MIWGFKGFLLLLGFAAEVESILYHQVGGFLRYLGTIRR